MVLHSLKEHYCPLVSFRLYALVSLFIQELDKILALSHNLILHVLFPHSYLRLHNIELMEEH